MKIAFRHVPFTPAQRAELDEMARAGGYETLWYADGATPQAEELKDCEVLMGYFPPALLPELSRAEMAANACGRRGQAVRQHFRQG